MSGDLTGLCLYMTIGIMKCNWSMNGNDGDIYRHLTTIYTKENWFCIPFVVDILVTELPEYLALVR